MKKPFLPIITVAIIIIVAIIAAFLSGAVKISSKEPEPVWSISPAETTVLLYPGTPLQVDFTITSPRAETGNLLATFYPANENVTVTSQRATLKIGMNVVGLTAFLAEQPSVASGYYVLTPLWVREA